MQGRQRLAVILAVLLGSAFASAGLASGQSGGRQFYVQSSTDDFGSKIVSAITFFASEVGTTDSLEALRQDDVFALAIRCRDKTLEAYVNHDGMFDPDRDYSTTARVRFGSGQPGTWEIFRSNDGGAAFFRSPQKLLRKITSVTQFAVQINADLTQSARFNVRGLSMLRAKFKAAGCSF